MVHNVEMYVILESDKPTYCFDDSFEGCWDSAFLVLYAENLAQFESDVSGNSIKAYPEAFTVSFSRFEVFIDYDSEGTPQEHLPSWRLEPKVYLEFDMTDGGLKPNMLITPLRNQPDYFSSFNYDSTIASADCTKGGLKQLNFNS